MNTYRIVWNNDDGTRHSWLGEFSADHDAIQTARVLAIHCAGLDKADVERLDAGAWIFVHQVVA